MLISRHPLLYLPSSCWEWMSTHWGVENNWWGHLGNIVCKTPWGLVFTRKTEHAHSIMWQSKTKQSALLYGRQLNQSNCAVKLLMAVNRRAQIPAWGWRKGNWVCRWILEKVKCCDSVCTRTQMHTHIKDIFDPSKLNKSLTHHLTYDSSFHAALDQKFVMGDSCIVF